MSILLSPDDLTKIEKRTESAQRVCQSDGFPETLDADGLYTIVNSAKDVIVMLEHLKSMQYPTIPQAAAQDVIHSYECVDPPRCGYIRKRKYQYMVTMLCREAKDLDRLLLAGVFPLHARLVQYWEDGATHIVKSVASGEANL